MDWKRLLKLDQNEVMGLDIGSSAVKIVQLRKKDDGYVVTAAGMTEMADDNEENNDRKAMNTLRAVGNCLESTGIQTRLAVCSVCGPEVAVRDFKFPVLPPEEIEGAVMLEASQVCPFNVNDGSVDYQLIPDQENNITGVLVAATNELIRTKRKLARSASLDSVLMDVDGLALLNCFNEYDKSEQSQTTAILNVGSSYTNLVIMGENGLPFVRDMTCAGNDIVEQIADDRNVSKQAVRTSLFGSDASGQSELEMSDSLAKACEKLITNVTETLRYYTAQEKVSVVEKIFVCGGFALAKGFVEILDARLTASAVLWNPFDKIPCHTAKNCRDLLQEKGPAMAVATGLAMRSI